MDVMEQWLTTQLLASEGADINLRPDFGGGMWPTGTSRVNYCVCQVVEHRIWQYQRRGEWRHQPWSRQWVRRADEFFARRRQCGARGRFFTSFAWIDDNSRGTCTFSFLTVAATAIQYQVWDEINWLWDKKKSAIYRFGSTLVPPVVVCAAAIVLAASS